MIIFGKFCRILVTFGGSNLTHGQISSLKLTRRKQDLAFWNVNAINSYV